MGVDGSMISKIEASGGQYYNKDGKNQDVFQILKENGVNFFRVRLWNSPENKFGRTYGGGENNIDTDIALAKRAKAVGMNVLLDFHYSDFWADPDDQQLPKAWRSLDKDQIPNAVYEYTKESLQSFKDTGVEIDACQIGNEINNGMCGDYGAIDWNNTSASFDYIASILSDGIKGMKEIFPDSYSVIHLANGGNKVEFETYFNALDERNVDYDIIGASYYPNISGGVDDLKTNLDNIATITGKPVMVAEISWGFTDDSVTNITENQYNGDTYEDKGGYLTSEQAQATCMMDVLNILAEVPNNLGLGMFYWEPAWLPVSGATWATSYGQSYKYTGVDTNATSYADGLATWCNQGLFSYTGKALSSLQVFNLARKGQNEVEETSTKLRNATIDVTLNIAADEKMPTTVPVETNYDAIRDANVTWDKTEEKETETIGTHAVNGKVTLSDGTVSSIVANVKTIENFVVDPGFENQGETDVVKTPWYIESVSPTGEKVAKLDRKTDIRSGKTDLNWYHSTKDFSFTVCQDINLNQGTYTLETFIMAIAPSDKAHTELSVFMKVGDVTYSADMKDIISGWNDGYHSTKEDEESTLTHMVIDIDNTKVTIGIKGGGVAGAWGHNDDWSLVKEIA
ncbi:MAG: glycosyl hydrolase 53 family protein [Bacilli bacterium]